MKQLLSPREAAERLGVSLDTVRKWVHRADDPLPSVIVGESGRNRKILAEQVPVWLEAEAARKAIEK